MRPSEYATPEYPDEKAVDSRKVGEGFRGSRIPGGTNPDCVCNQRTDGVLYPGCFDAYHPHDQSVLVNSFVDPAVPVSPEAAPGTAMAEIATAEAEVADAQGPTAQNCVGCRTLPAVYCNP